MTDNNALDILDETLDDLADKPSIEPFPNGSHKVTLNFKTITKDGRPSVMMKMTYIELLEASDPGAKAPVPGDVFTNFMHMKKKDGTPNEFGQGELKEVLTALKPNFPNAGTNRELLEAGEGCEVAVTTKIRKGKEGYQDAMNIVSMVLA